MPDRNERRITGIGGVFFKAKDPTKLMEWYRRHLGFPALGSDPGQGENHVSFYWRNPDDPDQRGRTIWSLFPPDTNYFDPSSSPVMMNYRVADLASVLDALRAEGVWVDDKLEESEFGKFGWIMDPEGNKIELWQPPEGW